MVGRPTKFTPERVQQILDAIALGATFRLACMYAGVSEDTFARWREAKTDFADAVKQAEGRGAIGWLTKIEKAANDDNWQAAAWKLERRYPQEYGRKVQEVTGANGGPVTAEIRTVIVERPAPAGD
jgi:transposase